MSAPEPPPPPVMPETDARPQVAVPSAGVPTWALALGAGAIGVAMLLTLNAQRARLAVTMPTRSYMPASVPALPRALDRAPGEVLAQGAPSPDAPDGPRGAYARVEEGSAFAAPVRWASPVPAPAAFSAPMPAARRGGGGMGSEGAPQSMRFATEPMPGAPVPPGAGGGMGRSAIGGGATVIFDNGRPTGTDDRPTGDGAARASIIRNRPSVVAQGEIVPATLETGINSTRPGLIRAVVSRDVRGFDGSRVLIPRGSRLIGEYRPDPAPGKRRILATWTRVIRPDGVAIRIDSPAADATGGIGLPGKVDSHFLARFANAALQTALQVGVNLASRPGNGAVIVSNTPQMMSGMGQTLVPGADEPPTVTVKPGAAIAVFVARDLDFSGVPAAR